MHKSFPFQLLHLVMFVETQSKQVYFSKFSKTFSFSGSFSANGNPAGQT